MKGTYFEGTFTSRLIKPNMSARYKIFVPECEGELKENEPKPNSYYD